MSADGGFGYAETWIRWREKVVILVRLTQLDSSENENDNAGAYEASRHCTVSASMQVQALHVAYRTYM